jgi:leucine dehydrogenase
MFEHPDFDGHERVVMIHEPLSGLKALIAIHSMAIGPAAGGCRLWDYSTSADALTDVLRLSRGMSFKNAMAGLPFGGGKAVILGPVAPENRTKVLLAFGEAVEGLAGDYITAEDVGIGVEDMDMVALRTRYVSGLSRNGVVGGDPSPFTARGVIGGIEAAVKVRLKRDDLEGLSVAVQGLGHVGGLVCEGLAKRGAKLLVSDINKARVNEMVAKFGAKAVKNDEILLQEADIVAPCALGAIITADVAQKIKANIVAGAANNQLATPEAGAILAKRGILYAPDYVINAGGIIMVSAMYTGVHIQSKVEAIVDQIGPRLEDIFARAVSQNLPPEVISDVMAKDLIAKAKRPMKGVKPAVLFA